MNPAIVEAQIQGQLVQTASRMFKEEITFNETNVTRLDWGSYPILRFDECPEVTPVVVQRMSERSSARVKKSWLLLQPRLRMPSSMRREYGWSSTR